MKIHRIQIAASILLMGFMGGPAYSAEKLKVGVTDWPSILAIGSIIREVAQSELGIEVELVTSTPPIMFASMDRGRGDIDVDPEVYLPNHQSLVTEYVDTKKSVALGVVLYRGAQGICTTKYIADKFGIKSVYDLANPDLAKHFSTDGEAKGKLWIGPPGWTSSKTETVRARDYGYDQYFELSTVEESFATVELREALRTNKPWVGYCYTPHAVFAQADVVMLSEPAYDPAKFKMVLPSEDPDWLAKSHVETAWQPVEAHIGYSTTLEKRLPAVIPLLKNMHMTTEEVGDWIRQLSVEKKDPKVFAKEWVEKNHDKVMSWLNN